MALNSYKWDYNYNSYNWFIYHSNPSYNMLQLFFLAVAAEDEMGIAKQIHEKSWFGIPTQSWRNHRCIRFNNPNASPKYLIIMT